MGPGGPSWKRKLHPVSNCRTYAVINPFTRYFHWLQKDNPTGRSSRFPVVDEQGRTNVPGLYVIGDLTGVPLLKLAAESGARFIEQLERDPAFAARRGSDGDPEILDLLIVGAGPAGVSAGIEALARGYRFRIVEASRVFNTIHDFPVGKPIFAEPEHVVQTATLRTPSGTKESLVEDLNEQIAGRDLPVDLGIRVESVSRASRWLEVEALDEAGNPRRYRARCVALAVGATGSHRQLDVPGEEGPNVFHRLIDARSHADERVLIVGGGDSALEAAIALAEAGSQVTVSYRGSNFTRPRHDTIRRLEELRDADAVEILFESNVRRIEEHSVLIATPDGERTLRIDTVFVLIGSEPPIPLLKRSGVQILGHWDLKKWLLLAYGVLFASVVYFGKKSTAWNVPSTDSHGGGLGYYLSAEFWANVFTIPGRAFERFGDTANYAWYGWRDLVVDLAAWAGVLLFIAMSIGVVVYVVRNRRAYFHSPWQTFKYAYFTAAAVVFVLAFFGGKYAGYELGGLSAPFWYSLLYSLTIVVFGFRRISRKPTTYIRVQTLTLMAVQVIPLFILPELVLPWLWKSGVIGPHSWLITNVFPIPGPGQSPEFWRAYGLVLAWPLFIYNLFTSHPTTFWLTASVVQTFVLIPLIVWKWGKGAYCGWICSCGGLAETLGDEYRTEAPHGPVPKKLENAGQWVLAFVFLLTAVKLMTVAVGADVPLLNMESWATEGEHVYSIVVDVLFAGVLGLGVYFFLSGRVWCRFLCPLAALMHIYARFTKYRIFADRKRCISCNICTSVCHMGIDVMGYANQGIPMNDVECVRCSACIVNCPMDVLTFGELPKSDPDNHLFMELPIVQRPRSDWTSGLQ